MIRSVGDFFNRIADISCASALRLLWKLKTRIARYGEVACRPPLLMKLIAPGRFLSLLTEMFAPTDAIWPAARQTAATDAFLT
jgi:hypothetical protein